MVRAAGRKFDRPDAGAVVQEPDFVDQSIIWILHARGDPLRSKTLKISMEAWILSRTSQTYRTPIASHDGGPIVLEVRLVHLRRTHPSRPPSS